MWQNTVTGSGEQGVDILGGVHIIPSTTGKIKFGWSKGMEWKRKLERNIDEFRFF